MVFRKRGYGLDRLDFGGSGEAEDAKVSAPQAAAEYFPLSPAQLGIWYAQHMDPQVPINIAQYVDIRGDLDLAVAEQATLDAANESGSFFLRIVERDGEPMQTLDPSQDTTLTYIDLRGEADPVAAAAEWMRAEYSRPLNIVNDRLMRGLRYG